MLKKLSNFTSLTDYKKNVHHRINNMYNAFIIHLKSSIKLLKPCHILIYYYTSLKKE